EPDNSLSMGDEHLDTIPATESNEFIKSGVENLIPILSESEGIPEHMCDVPSHDNSSPLDVSKDQIKAFSESNKEFSSIDDYSFSIDDIDYLEASPPDSELVSSEVMEIVIPEVGEIDDDILLTIEHDVLRENLRNVNLLISKIEALNANPTPSSDCKTKSFFASLISLMEETNTFDNSLPEFETFCFDVEEISSVSTTTHPDISLPEYEAFHDDHVKEISSGSPTTHSDSSLNASFIFDLSINPFPPADRSAPYEFTDELIPFISALEYDCFRFKVEQNSRDFTKDVVEDISPTKEPQVLTALPTYPTLQLNMKFQPSSESLFTYVVWIFFPFLVMGDEHLDTIPATESDKFIKSSVEDLIPIPNQFEDFSESNEEFSSTDDDSFSFDKIDYVEASPSDSELVSSESCSDEDVLEKIVLKPLSEEEIIPMESLRTHDSSLPISSKINSLLDEFAGELTLLKSIPPGIDETCCNFEEDIRLIEKLLYDNSSLRLPEEFVSANSDAESESFSSSPIIVKDSDSLMEEIDLFCTPDYPMPPGIKDKDYDSERDILFLRTCLAIIPFHLLKKSHSILIFLRFLVLLQTTRW
nr:hypothetical protein [Tanacetum cinerariifolium]